MRGLAVIDMNGARKVGEVDDVLLDTDGRRVAGYALSEGRGMFGAGDEHTFLDQTAVHAIGPDALTVNLPGEIGGRLNESSTYCRMGDVTGRQVVSESGQLVGTIKDVLIVPENGRILGYALNDNTPASPLGNLFGHDEGPRSRLYLLADADLRFGPDLVIAPDEAVVDQLMDDATIGVDDRAMPGYGATATGYSVVDGREAREAGPSRETELERSGLAADMGLVHDDPPARMARHAEDPTIDIAPEELRDGMAPSEQTGLWTPDGAERDRRRP